jgi:hypothetical protein
MDVLDVGADSSLFRDSEHRRRLVDSDNPAGGFHELSEPEGDMTKAGAEIEHSHSGCDAGVAQEQRRRHGDAGGLRVQASQLGF